MSEKTYYRASLGLKKEISGMVADDYSHELIGALKDSDQGLELPDAQLTIYIAREFGFCYGVDKAVDMAYEARRKFPDKRIFLLTEIIHNPRVNKRMIDMGLIFLSGGFKHPELTKDDITSDDVVLIPAFGTAAGDFEELKQKGAIIVDTTCGSVVHVWKRVERYAKDGFTSLIHGKYFHEETIATVSMAQKEGGHTVVVRNMEQADAVCDFIRGRIDSKKLRDVIPAEAFSENFDPDVHLKQIGVANQTTMLASESLSIAAKVGDAIADRDGVASRQDTENFRSFDTICSATQDRQDAVEYMLKTKDLDLMIVIGGFNSSNTTHLLKVSENYCRAFHIDDASALLSEKEISHLPYGSKEPVISSDWLPDGPLTVGFTAGASTPNRVIYDTMEQLSRFRGVELDAASQEFLKSYIPPTSE